jgi:putative phage-type endonuclease
MSDQLQRNKQWFESRVGKFTSSRINDLMGIKGLNLTGEDYAFELAIEIVQGRDEDDGFLSFDMQKGIELEPYAFIKFSQLMAMRFSEVTKCGFIELNENTGSSPDGLVDDDGVLEIKCPKAKTFFKLVRTGKIDQKYMDQMQHQMYCTGRKKAYFFNYIIYNGVELYHLIEVERDQDRIDLMRSRIDEAVIVRDSFVSELKGNAQYNLY